MTWWNATVRIRAPGTLGSGVLIAPDIVLTAAHVLAQNPGSPASLPTRVTIMYGPVAGVAPIAACTTAEWDDDDAAAHLHDLALVRIEPSGTHSFSPDTDFWGSGGPRSCAAFGFVDDPAREVLLRGTFTSDGYGLRSPDVHPEPGMSGGPILFEPASGPPRLVGVVRSGATSADSVAALGLRADVLAALRGRLP